MSTKLQKIRELKEEAEAIRALLKACDGSKLKSRADYWRERIVRGADRLAKAASDLQDREATNTSEAAE